MRSISVRKAIATDLDELSALFDQYRVFQGKKSDLQAAKVFLQHRLERAESVVFMAHEGSVPLGFAQLYPSFSSTSLARVFILNDLFVHANGRRKGVASKLLAALEAYAWSEKATRVTLNVAMDNPQAQALYEAKGWSRDAQFFMYHRFPAVA